MSKTYLCLMLVCISLVACAPPDLVQPGASQTGTFVLSLHARLMTQTIEPTLDMNVASYDVYGDGPGDAVFELLDVSSSVVEQPGLLPGLWAITAYGKNAAGTVIGMGQTEALVVAGDVAVIEVAVSPLSGDGTLTFTLDWPDGVLESPAVSATLTPSGGMGDSLTIGTSGSSASYSDVHPNGYYTLALSLLDDGVPVWGTLEAVRIVSGEQSEKHYILVRDVNRGGFTITPDMQNPIVITFSGNEEILDLGYDMTVTATTSEPVDSYQWYLQGSALVGEVSPTLTIGTDLGLGVYRLDLMVQKGTTIASNGFSFEVLESNIRSVVEEAGDVGLAPSVGADGRLIYVSYGDWDNYDVKFARSTDGGVSWTTMTLDANGNAGVDSSLIVDDGDIYVGYHEHISGDFRLRLSTDSGDTWATETVHDGIGVQPHLHSDGTILRAASLGPDGALMYSQRPLSGGTWQHQTVQDGNFGAVDIDVDGDSVYMACYSWATYELYLATSDDGGATWSFETVDDSGQVSRTTALTVEGDTLVIGYYRYGRFYVAVSHDRGATWTISIADDTVTSGQYLSMDSHGSVFAASYFTSSGLTIARSNDSGTTWTVSTIDDAGTANGGTSLLFDDNRLYVAYRDANDTSLQFGKSSDAGISW